MIIFNDAQTLSVSHNFEYLGDSFNYRKTNSFSIKGLFISDNASDGFTENYFGVAYLEDTGIWYPMGSDDPIVTGATTGLSGYLSWNGNNAVISVDGPDVDSLFGGAASPLYDIWAEMDSIRDRMQDFQEIVVNGVSLGSGRVISFSFPQNVDARRCEYTVEFETYHTGNLYNWTGDGYQNTTIDTGIACYISNLSESFDFDFLKDGTLNYDRSLEFDLISNGNDYAADVQKAKDFASGLMFGDPAFDVVVGQYPAFYQSQGNRIFSETYNAIQGSYSFKESFKGPTAGESYYWTNGFTLSVDSEGETTINEKGTVQGVRTPIYDYALSGMEEIESTSLARAAEVLEAYAGGSCGDDLFLKLNSKNIDRFAGKIDYSFDYSSDPFSVGCYTVTRALDTNYDDNGLMTISEQGSVSDRCGPSGAARLQNAVNYFTGNISGDILSRVFEYYEDRVTGCGCTGAPSEGDLRLFSRENTYSDFNGLFGYNYVFKNDCSSLVDECYIITREKEIKDTIHNVFLGVTLNSGEIAQGQDTSSLIRETQRIAVVGQCPALDMDDYLIKAKAAISVPTGLDTYYMDGADYIFDPDNSRFELSVYYNYTGYRTYSNINV